MKRVCLDAGHFGLYNRSPVNPAYYESVRMWVLHEKLARALAKRGVEVLLTRADQKTDLGLETRGKKAKGYDLFLSLHSNAASAESVDYTLAYVPLNGSGTEIGQLLADCVADVMQTRQAGRTAIRAGSGGADYYGVIRGAVSVGVPAVILEHSFHTNKRATEWLLQEENLDKLAEAEADVIARWLGLEEQEGEDLTYEEFKRYMQKYEAEKNAAHATWEKGVMAEAKSAGLMDGTRPKANITRGEVAQVLKNAGLM